MGFFSLFGCSENPDLDESVLVQLKKAGSDFAYGGPLTEIALVGVIATKFLGQELKWDGGPFRKNDDANAMMKPDFRRNWGL